MEHLSEGVERRLGYRFGEGRVGVDRQIHLFHRKLVLPRDGQLVNQLGRVCADDVRAEDLAVLGVADDLDEAFGLARGARASRSRSPSCSSRRTRASVGREGEPADLVVDFLFLDLCLGHPDRRDFGVTVGRVRNVAVVHAVDFLLARQVLGEYDALS